MPELPEVETVCRGLTKSLAGKRMSSVTVRRASLRTPLPRDLSEKLAGRRVERIERRAKYIQIFLDNDHVLLLHLGMSGRMVVSHQPTPPQKHDHLVFDFEDGTHVRFNDPRRFGCCDLVAAKNLAQHHWLKHLGIEPLSDAFEGPWLQQSFRGKRTSIKTALMDQRLVVGVGNIYASESLFFAGINPKRLAGRCRAAELDKLAKSVKKVLRAAIDAGGSSLRDYRQADGELGYFQHHFAVYDREGEACPGCSCDRAKTGGIKRIVQGGRSTFLCKTKQL